jgi:5-hydroxyisourate hydrolase-like protein (transthyretin family)
MSYVFSGRLRTHTCDGSVVPVANATVMLYRPGDEAESGFALREHESVRDRSYAMFCQGRTNEQGEFRMNFTEKTIYGYRGSTHAYAGEPFVLDVYVRSADGSKLDHDPEPVQFTVGVVTPEWQDDGDGKSARWEHEISEAAWAQVREALDAWSIVGRVVRGDNKQPAAGLNVLAYDADLIKDDFLGSATTDADGRFRIDYPGSAFRQTPVRGAEFERGGPELYFRVETADGQLVLKEDKSRGNKPDRANATNCFSVELTVEGVPSSV